MIETNRLQSCIKALQAIVIQARLLAYKGDSHQTIAGILDDADYLFNLLQEKDDNTLKFRDILVIISERYDCAFVLERFDDEQA